MKQTILTALILISTALMSAAQQFGCSWVSLAPADSTSQVWFRRTYVCPERPRQAFITVASTGFFTLYVNGRNVSNAVRTPSRTPADTLARSMTFCADRFLRPDTNTIAVWYSPTFPRADTRQLSLCFHGTYSSGERFAFWSDGTWLCRKADTSLTADGGEAQQAQKDPWRWNGTDTRLAMWQHAEEAEGRGGESVADSQWLPQGTRVSHIMAPRYFDDFGDSIVYDFGQGFYGTVRITLRDCVPGERINADGLVYTCNGENDEQAFRRFTAVFRRKVPVSGDRHFRPSQIQSVEALEMTDTPAF